MANKVSLFSVRIAFPSSVQQCTKSFSADRHAIACQAAQSSKHDWDAPAAGVHTIRHSAKAVLSLVVSLALSAPPAAVTFPHAYHSRASPHPSAGLQSDGNRSDHTVEPVRSCRPPGALHRHDPLAPCAAWIGIAEEPDTLAAPSAFSTLRIRSMQARRREGLGIVRHWFKHNDE